MVDKFELLTLFGRSRQSLPGWVGIRRNLSHEFSYATNRLKRSEKMSICVHTRLKNGNKPGLNKSRHRLGDVVTEHVGASPDVSLEVADVVTLVAHLQLRRAILDPGLFYFDQIKSKKRHNQYLGRSLSVSLTVVVL